MRLHVNFSVFLAAIIFTLSTTGFAAEKQTSCSDTEIKQINQKYTLKINIAKFQDNSFHNYSCIKAKPDNKIIFAYLLENPNDLSEHQDNSLSILVLDANQKLLNRLEQKDFFPFSGLEFEGIRLENVAFSTLNNTTVFGLTSRETKFGDPSLSNHELNLFKVSPSGKIQQILFHFPSYTYASLSRLKCKDATTDLVDRKLILSNQLHHGLQDIIIKEVKTSHGSDYKSCKSSENKYKRQHIMKFNGERYIFNEHEFLQSDGI